MVTVHGHELHRVVRAHGELYADLKKANLYYLLDRLAKEGDLHVTVEPGTRGARGERLIYGLTDQGRSHFNDLLREIIRGYEGLHTGIEVAIVFLSLLPVNEAIALLEERQRIVSEHRLKMAVELGDNAQASVLGAIAADHMLTLIDAELTWIDRSLLRLRENGWETDAADHTAQKGDEKD